MHLNKGGIEYRPSWYFRNGHVSTLYSGLFRPAFSVPGLVRSRFETSDGDFLDLDISRVGSNRLVVLLHGLEGNTRRPYMAGMQRLFLLNGWDTLALNFRGCSGEPNRLLRSYHSGETEDLREVLKWIVEAGIHRRIALIGFSLGGNVILKYLAEEAGKAVSHICCGAVFSVPCDLASSCAVLDRGISRYYGQRFLKTLIPKSLEKIRRFPGSLDEAALSRVSTLRDFDEVFTAPVHGFSNAEDYYERSSSVFLLNRIEVPILMVQAQDDPFLSSSCFPSKLGTVVLEKTTYGGHVGFPGADSQGFLWSEHRALEFCENIG